jgi:hypothetical protein
MNEANGMSHIQGKVAQSGDELLGNVLSFKHGLEIRNPKRRLGLYASE